MTIDVSSGSVADLDALEPLWLGIVEHDRFPHWERHLVAPLTPSDEV